MALPIPPEDPRPGIDESDALEILARGELEVRGRIVDASNATLLAEAELDGVRALCVYKPTAGERPLWDFPTHTLANREAATYLLSAATGWGLVPPTTLRADGPFGAGSVQWWILGDPAEDDEMPVAEPGAGLVDVVPPNRRPPGWLDVVEASGWDGERVVLVHADDPDLRRLAVLDAVANNADRKGGHILRSGDGRVYGVDHGLTFNEDEKLRTVLWGWAGDPLPDEAVEVLEQLATDLAGDGALRRGLLGLLDRGEVQRTLHRVRRLLSSRRHPRPGGHRPSIPWPAF
ncbi:MAG TPA: SCO1664 family protein [Kineosporiaceae bacterium]|nr:SCO1664 family protein [Kineosporiaceae bacterium]